MSPAFPHIHTLGCPSTYHPSYSPVHPHTPIYYQTSWTYQQTNNDIESNKFYCSSGDLLASSSNLINPIILVHVPLCGPLPLTLALPLPLSPSHLPVHLTSSVSHCQILPPKSSPRDPLSDWKSHLPFPAQILAASSLLN